MHGLLTIVFAAMFDWNSNEVIGPVTPGLCPDPPQRARESCHHRCADPAAKGDGYTIALTIQTPIPS